MKNLNLHLILSLFLCFLLTTPLVTARTWTLINGERIEGEFDRAEKQWIFINRDDGTKTAVEYLNLIKTDRDIARNLSAIFSGKPPELDATQAEIRVPAPKPTRPKQADTPEKPVRQLTQIPQKEPSAQIDTISRPDTPLTPAPQTEEAKSSSSISKVNQTAKKITSLDPPIKLVKEKNWRHFLAELHESADSHKVMIISISLLSLAAILRQARQMRFTSHKPFRPEMVAQIDTAVLREMENEDREQQFMQCPFCGVTNPASTETCRSCGQYLKLRS